MKISIKGRIYMKRLLLSSAGAIMLTVPVFADVGPTIHTVTGARSIADHASTVNSSDVAHYVTPGETDFVVSSIINANVKNNQNETIGEVKDIVIRSNQLEGIVVAVGGFLGVGERYVVVDPSTVHMSVVNGTWRISTNATKDSLKSAPEFKYEGRWAR